MRRRYASIPSHVLARRGRAMTLRNTRTPLPRMRRPGGLPWPTAPREGCFTGLWARLLVEDFVAGSAGDVASWPASLPALQERWDADVSARDAPLVCRGERKPRCIRHVPGARDLQSPATDSASGKLSPSATAACCTPVMVYCFARFLWNAASNSTTFRGSSVPECHGECRRKTEPMA